MAPRRTGKVRVVELQVKDDLAGARADGDHHHHNKTQSNVPPVDIAEANTTAKLKRTAIDLAEKVMVIEERSIFLGDVLKMNRGTREVENFVRKQEGIRHEDVENLGRDEIERMMTRERELVARAMQNKLDDNISKGARKPSKIQ